MKVITGQVYYRHFNQGQGKRGFTVGWSRSFGDGLLLGFSVCNPNDSYCKREGRLRVNSSVDVLKFQYNCGVSQDENILALLENAVGERNADLVGTRDSRIKHLIELRDIVKKVVRDQANQDALKEHLARFITSDQRV